MSFKALYRIVSVSLVLVFTLGSPHRIVAQDSEDYPTGRPMDVIVLDLYQAVRYALDQSWRIERGRMGLSRAEFNLAATRAALKSNASMSFTVPDFDQSLTDWTDSSGITHIIKKRSAKYSSRISIQQPLGTDGVVSLNGVMNRSQVDLFSYSPTNKYYGSVFLKFDQPILQPNGIKNDIRRAELSLEEARLGFQDEEIRIETEVSRSFFELLELTYKDKLAAEEVERIEQAYSIGQPLFESGSLSEVNLLQLEVELASRRDRASAAAGRLDREKDDFKQEIGLPLEDEIRLEPVLEYISVEIDEAALLEKAMQQRSDIRRTIIRRENHEMDIRERRSQGRLTGNVSITLGLDAQGKEIPNLADSWMDPDQARGAAITFSLPLWDWGRNDARVASKQVDLDQNYLQEEENIKTITREVSSATARVREAESRLNLLKPSVEAADRSYQLSLQQFESGELNVLDILLTQNRLVDSHNSYLEAYLDYRRAIIDMRAVATGAGYGRGRSFFRD
ncbi:MAG: TolC family protein [Candidatus Latescibacteria bacterium]|nr:TolC family protein [Candidatus Latescibacterota bacterium]